MQVIRQNSPNKVRGASSHRIAYSDALVLPKDFREVLIKTPSPFLLLYRNLSSQSPQGLWLITHTRLHSYLIHRGSLEGQVHKSCLQGGDSRYVEHRRVLSYSISLSFVQPDPAAVHVQARWSGES